MTPATSGNGSLNPERREGAGVSRLLSLLW
jgi:hypothetical protein